MLPKLTTSFVVLFFLFQLCEAQRISLNTFMSQTHNFSTGTTSVNPYAAFKFHVEGEPETKIRGVGMFGGRIRPYLTNDTEAIKHLNTFRTLRITALSSVGLAIGSFVMYAQGDKDNYTFLGFTIGFALANGILAGVSNGHMRRAVDTYNNNLKMSSRLSISPLFYSGSRIEGTQVGLVMKF
jgi:hypothetical protein